MSDDKPKVSDKASEIAKNIWLAGLGAYGKAVDDAQDRLERVTRQPPRLFRDLVKKGEALEEEVRESLSNARDASRESVEERIRRVRENFRFSAETHGEDLAAIHDKLDALTKKVNALTKKVDALAAPKKPARKTSPRSSSPPKPKA